MLRHIAISFAVVLLLIAPRPADAQRLAHPIGFTAQRSSSPNARLVAFQSSGGMPRWVKWGLVGAVAGAHCSPSLANQTSKVAAALPAMRSMAAPLAS